MWNLLSSRNTPRWVIFSIDTVICISSLILAYQLRFNFNVPDNYRITLPLVMTLVIFIRISSFFISKIYAGIIRYTGNRDAVRVFLTISLGTITLAAINVLSYIATNSNIIPYSILIIDYLGTTFLLLVFRIGVKSIYLEIKNPTRKRRDIMIYGAGEAGMITKRTLDRDAGMRYKVIAFFDDDKSKHGKTIEGVKIYNPATDLDDLVRANNVVTLIISVQNIAARRKQEIIQQCINHQINVLDVPPVNNWINGELSFNQLRKINIEDLLDRDPIQLNTGKIAEACKEQVILITGGAGSIGSEIARQLIKFNPKKLILLDQAESPLYDIELELQEKYKIDNFETVVADVCNTIRMERVFNYYQPSMVFHAAAYKHVPMMEVNPSEGLHTNIQGTKVVADLANKYHSKAFVMISTDKAVNPTSIMGATKRIAEIYCQALNAISHTHYITTRFGNVLDSNGSVIPRFKKQIENGGPVTVTHPEVTRYFMTIPEAAQLVLEAAAMGQGGEIYVFDMGKSIKIYELALNMIKLSGLEPEKDIKITFTGLRPGEKLYEELFFSSENNLPTHHPKILISNIVANEFEMVKHQVAELIALFDHQNNEAITAKIKSIVPEYQSS